jgi:hypothetical protein
MMASQGDERELTIQRSDGPGFQVGDGQVSCRTVGRMRGDDALGGLVERKLDVVPVRAHVGCGSKWRRKG